MAQQQGRGAAKTRQQVCLVPLDEFAATSSSGSSEKKWWHGELCATCEAKFAAQPPYYYFTSKKCDNHTECKEYIFGASGAFCRPCAQKMVRCWRCGGTRGCVDEKIFKA